MPKLPDVETAIKRGLTFLGKNQEADGSFISFSSASMQPFRHLRSWQTTFVPALMLASLTGLGQHRAINVRKKLAAFLLKQRDPNWSFNYWAKDAPEQKTQPYPNDLDDTFCVLAALYLHDPAIINETVLAQVIKVLLSTETAVGGPYRTWLVPPASEPIWQDVDVAVNSNINYFLSLIGSRLPKLDDLMGQAITTNSFSSPYYPSVYAFIYYFARSYGGPHKNLLLRKARRRHKAAKTDLDRALCLNARLRLGDTQDLTTSVNDLLSGQRRDGSWPAAAFYADPVKNGKLYYNGAPALTTAFVLEALQLYLRAGQPPSGTVTAATDKDQALHEAVLKLAKNQCQQLGPDLRTVIIQSLDAVANSSNGAEIIGLARHFKQSLAKPPGSTPDGFIETLSLANLYGWLAYTIYDDFLDEEGKPNLVSVANAAMRRSLDCFCEALPSDPDFSLLVRQTFDAIDSANAWELAYCRFEVHDGRLAVGKLPDYGNFSKLAERSLGHALPPMAVLAAGGLKPDDKASQQMLQAFQHYLIARQLNDDAHDWPEDLQNGHITPVVAMLLAELKVKPGSHPLPGLLAQARRQFWHTTLPEICRLMRRHVRLSRQNLSRSGLLKSDNVISGLLDKLERSINDTMSQQSQAEDFLKHYKTKQKVKP